MKVYLSPSNQPNNKCKLGHSEKDHCEELVRKMLPLLLQRGIQYKVRNPHNSMYVNVKEATAWGANLYMPIHTNAAGGRARGTRFGYYPGRMDSMEACKIFKANWLRIYPEGVGTVKVGTYTFYEAKHPKCPCVYTETIFHDQLSDALWFHENMDKVALNFVESISEFFKINKPPEEVEPLYEAEVKTLFPLSLGLWNDTKRSKRLMFIPNHAIVKVLEEVSPQWARIQYGVSVGYSDRQYLIRKSAPLKVSSLDKVVTVECESKEQADSVVSYLKNY